VTPHAAEAAQGVEDPGLVEPIDAGGGEDRQRVGDVVRPGHRQAQLHLASVRPGDAHHAPCLGGDDRRQRPQVVGRLEPIEDHRAGRAGDERPHLRRVAAGDEEPVGRQQRDEALIGGGERLRRRVEIGVVVLDAGQDERLRLVVQELGAAVEVGGVVLVPFDDEARAGAAAEARREVARHAADQIAGIGAALAPHPRRHGGGRRLAVGAGDDERPAAGEEEARQGLRHRDERQPAALGLDRLRVVARHGVADDDQVGGRLEVLRIEADVRPHAAALEERAHRRVERPVGAAHAVPQLLQQAGQGRHARAADRDAVDVEGIHR
jgi:hypothetical protein